MVNPVLEPTPQRVREGETACIRSRAFHPSTNRRRTIKPAYPSQSKHGCELSLPRHFFFPDSNQNDLPMKVPFMRNRSTWILSFSVDQSILVTNEREDHRCQPSVDRHVRLYGTRRVWHDSESASGDDTDLTAARAFVSDIRNAQRAHHSCDYKKSSKPSVTS